MQCSNDQCDSTETKVIETRPTLAAIYRRRSCPVCKHKYVTVEVMAPLQSIPAAAISKHKVTDE